MLTVTVIALLEASESVTVSVAVVFLRSSVVVDVLHA